MAEPVATRGEIRALQNLVIMLGKEVSQFGRQNLQHRIRELEARQAAEEEDEDGATDAELLLLREIVF